MRKPHRIIALGSVALALGLGGCGGGAGGSAGLQGLMTRAQGGGAAGMGSYDPETMMAKQKLMMELMNEPDLPAWHAQRERMAMAVGDRTFDKTFDVVFDGMTIALASMGARVNNIDRQSGYITAFLPDLGPELKAVLQKEALAEYAVAKGYPIKVTQKTGGMDDMIDASMGQNMMSRMGGSGLTLTMAKFSPTQTKVKLRFDNIYYPRMLQELYTRVWAAVDKQMFLDKALDAPRP
ncbi:MAG: hypothetical protein ABIZ49_04090 [Opitutaceae bacterium]